MEKLSRNFLWVTAANAASGFFNTIIFIYLARVLLPEAFGYLSYALTITYFLSNFIDLGLSTFGIREIAKNRSRGPEFVSEIVSLRLIVCVTIFLISILVISLSSNTLPVKALLIESIFMLFLWALASEWAFQGKEEMHMVFVSLAATGALQLLLMYVFVKYPEDLLRVPILFLAAAIPIAAALLKRLNFSLKIKRQDLKRATLYLSSSFVMWSISIFAQVYNALDIFMLALVRSLEEVGYFTVARRFIGGFTLFAIFIAHTLLPRLSHSFCNDITQFEAAVRKFLKLAAILTIFIFLPIAIFSKALILLTVGTDYIPAVKPFVIMVMGLVMVLFNVPYSTALIAMGLEREVLKQAASCAVVSVILNFILIPKYGMIGTSVTFVAVEAMALIWITLVYKKQIKKCIKKEVASDREK